MSAAIKLSVDHLQNQIAELQNDYQKKMTAAATAGNFQLLQELSQELIAKVTSLTDKFNQPQNQSFYKSDLSLLNLEDYVCHVEKFHFESIHNDVFLGNLVKKFVNERTTSTFHNVQADMAKHALRLDLRLTPQLQSIIEHCKNVLKLTATPSVYVMASPNINAFAMPSDQGKISIGLTSAALEKLTAAELSYVVGHELGHILLGHVHFPTQSIIRSNHPEFTPLHAMKFFAWQRAAELSADRFGLLCGESFEKSAGALFKVCYGIAVDDRDALISYLDQLSAETSELEKFIATEDFFSTHPLPPIRLSAMAHFSKNEDTVVMEQKTKELLALCENTFLHEPQKLNAEVQKFLLYSSVLLCMADGEFSESELTALAKTLQRPLSIDEINAILEEGPQKVANQVGALAGAIRGYLSDSQILTLTRDICLLIVADGLITPTEVSQMYAIAGSIGVAPAFIDKVLSDYMK